MATSAEIAEQIAAQQSWFMQQNAMATQVGVNPMAYGGLGGWGMGGGAAMPPHPGMAPMPGAFNYGAGFGYGAGNRAGAYATSALSMLPIGLGVGMQAHSMLTGGGGLAPFSNPFAAFSMARGAGLGFGASAGLAGASMLPLMAVGHAVGGMVGGAQQQSMINTAVGNYNFANPQSMTGFGFSRQDAAAVGQQVRQLAMIPELMTSFQEISRILPQLKTMGVMQGVRDAAEFNRRMKDAIGTIRDVSRIIGSSLEEAADFFAHSRRVGFFGREAQVQNAMNARVTGSLTGMDTNQVMAMQGQGAAFGTAVGGSRALGTLGVTAIANRIGAAVIGNPGLQQTLENITGMTGAEAVGGAAGMMQNLGQRIAGTGPGRFIMAGFMKVDANGEVSLDRDLMQRQQRGEVGMGEIRARGMRNMSNRNFVVKFERRQTRLAQQFAAEGGPESMVALLEGAGISEDASAYILQSQYGATEQQADLAQAMLRENRTGLGEQRRLVQEVIQRQIRRREQGPGGLLKRMGTVIQNAITQPFARAGAEMHRAVGQFVDEVYEDVMGDFVIEATEEGKKDFIRALSGNRDAAKRAFGAASRSGIGRASVTAGFREAITSGAISPLLSDAVAWVKSIGTTGTGRSEEDDRRWFGRTIGAGAEGTPEAMRKQFTNLSMGGGISSASMDALRNLRVSMEANVPEYYDATPTRQMELFMKAAGSSGDPAIRQAMDTFRRLGGGVDPRARAFAASGVDREQYEALITKGGRGPMDPDAVRKAGRDARTAMLKEFGPAGEAIMKSTGAQELFNQIYGTNLTPDQQNALKSAIVRRDVTAIKKLTNLTNVQLDDVEAVRGGLEASGPSGMAATIRAFRDFQKAAKDENALGMRDALVGAARDADYASKKIGGAVGAAVAAFGEAATGLAGNLGSNEAYDKLNETIEATVKAIEAVPDQDKRNEILGSLNSSLRAAVVRRIATKKPIDALSKRRSATVSEIMKATGLTEAEVGGIYGKAGLRGSDIMPMDPNIAAKISRTVSATGVGALLGAGTEDLAKKAKEDQQVVLFRTMTAALVHIAKHTGITDKFNVPEEYTANQNAVNKGKATPGTK